MVKKNDNTATAEIDVNQLVAESDWEGNSASPSSAGVSWR
jgi:hypothetical protein